MFLRKLIQPVRRGFSTTALRRGHDPGAGKPGGNLPFSIHSKYKFALGLSLFCMSGLTVPLLCVRHSLLKKLG